MPVDSISRTDVLDVLTPIWTRPPETAQRDRPGATSPKVRNFQLKLTGPID